MVVFFMKVYPFLLSVGIPEKFNLAAAPHERIAGIAGAMGLGRLARSSPDLPEDPSLQGLMA